MKPLLFFTFSFSLFFISYGTEPNQSSLEIQAINFEPIRQGKNIVKIKVLNKSDIDRIFGLSIYTRSVNYGKNGVGWGTSFYEEIKAGQTKEMRFGYKIQGPVTDSDYVKLAHYDVSGVNGFDINDYDKIKKHRKLLLKKQYFAKELEKYDRQKAKIEKVDKETTEAVVNEFHWLQQYIKNENYKQAWQCFSKEYKQSEYQSLGYDGFLKAMSSEKLIEKVFSWDKDIFVELKAVKSIQSVDGRVEFEALFDGHNWRAAFIKEDEKWKLDDLTGYTPQLIVWQDWEKHTLPLMKQHSSEHFDIYYFRDSTAEKQCEEIAHKRENGYEQICEFLDDKSNRRIRLVFFEDGKQKHWQTGHQGNGWAYGNTIVEVYNKDVKLDPYHEMTHILMGTQGRPPALFNEGFAVYMSERLGADALMYLGGGKAKIKQQVKKYKDENKWIELEELITYTNIGSQGDMTSVAYAEAASFVKFLITKYGKAKFLDAYKTLKNSEDKKVHVQNVLALQMIYGKTLPELKEQWIEYLNNKGIEN